MVWSSIDANFFPPPPSFSSFFGDDDDEDTILLVVLLLVKVSFLREKDMDDDVDDFPKTPREKQQQSLRRARLLTTKRGLHQRDDIIISA